MMTHTTDTSIFTKMDTDSLLRNYRAYTDALANQRHAYSHPALQLGLSLCLAEMKERGIEADKIDKVTK
jgi:hypothetical protein